LQPCPRCRFTVAADCERDGVVVAQNVMRAGAASAATTSPYVRLGAGMRDPFQSFPIPADSHTEFLLQYCTLLFAWTLLMLLTRRCFGNWLLKIHNRDNEAGIASLSPSIATLEVTTMANEANPVVALVQTMISEPAMLHGLVSFSSSLMDARSGRQTPHLPQ
jgi:hypothetical protein